jgi:hypothetical protein
VQLEAQGAPIISAECHCESCRTAGAKLQALPSAPSFVEPNGGTRFVLYRKDRVRFLDGAEALKEFRLRPEAKTRRVLASCCNTPMFLEFESGHWLSLYGCVWPKESMPKLELRTMTVDRPPGPALPDDVPNAKTQSFKFFVKLFGAWIAMGFKRPTITVPGGEIRL